MDVGVVVGRGVKVGFRVGVGGKGVAVTTTTTGGTGLGVAVSPKASGKRAIVN